jgi:hypothetical protein
MTDHYSNPYQQNPRSGPFPPQNPQPGQYPPQNPPSGPFQQQGPQSGGFPSQQSPSSGSFPSASSFPSYYTSTQSGPGQQPEQAPRSKARLVLIVAAVLMFAAGGVFAGLYVAAESDHDKATSVLEDKKAELADVREEISSAEDAKSTAEQNNSDIEAKNSALKPCVEATQHYLWDGTQGAERDAAIDAMFAACGG